MMSFHLFICYPSVFFLFFTPTLVASLPLPAAAVWPRVLQVVRGGAAPERRGQIVPPLPQATTAGARQAIRAGALHVREDRTRN